MRAFPGPLTDWFRGKRRSCAALGLLVAGLASPALAAGAGGGAWSRLFGWVSDSKPPWAVEAPGGAGERYGLGLDLFFEHQESLRITFMEQRLQTLDLQTGRDVGEIIRTDPGLLNRKFDLRWDLKGVGAQPAVALPLPRTLGIYPTLVLQAAGADVSLDFHDRNRPGDSSSLSGRGPLFGAGLDLTTSLCRSCPWFAGASYFFQKLPSLTVDRSPAFGPQGFAVLEDKVRLGRDVHEVSTRAGYGFPGNRALSYLGVRHRWTDLDINDHLRTRDPFGVFEMSLDSRTRLKSEVTLALAGVEARLGPGLFGRLETSVGGGDRGALLRVVYVGNGREPSIPPSPPSAAQEDEAKQEQRAEQRAREIAEKIAPDLAGIEAAFLAGWKSLKVVAGPDGQPAYIAREVDQLLNKTEGDLLAALGRFPELEALGDWVRDEFRSVRAALELSAGKAATSRTAKPGRVSFASLASWQLAQATERSINKGRTDARLSVEVEKGRKMARSGTPRTRLIFKTSLGRGARLEIFPRYHPDRQSPCWATLSPDKEKWVYWGDYVFNIYKVQGAQRHPFCDPKTSESVGNCPLNLVLVSCEVLSCDDEACDHEECP